MAQLHGFCIVFLEREKIYKYAIRMLSHWKIYLNFLLVSLLLATLIQRFVMKNIIKVITWKKQLWTFVSEQHCLWGENCIHRFHALLTEISRTLHIETCSIVKGNGWPEHIIWLQFTVDQRSCFLELYFWNKLCWW